MQTNAPQKSENVTNLPKQQISKSAAPNAKVSRSARKEIRRKWPNIANQRGRKRTKFAAEREFGF
jgi:hypothetical protein